MAGYYSEDERDFYDDCEDINPVDDSFNQEYDEDDDYWEDEEAPSYEELYGWDEYYDDYCDDTY